MNPLTGTVVFFDIGGTLASVALSSNADRIEQLAVYPYVPGVLAELRERGARLGIISDPGSPHRGARPGARRRRPPGFARARAGGLRPGGLTPHLPAG